MKKKFWFGSLLFVGMLSATAVGIQAADQVEAAADTVDTRFEMQGAAVRFDYPTGLRFEALVGADLAEDDSKSFGMIIFPENIMEGYGISTTYVENYDYVTEIKTKAADYIAQYGLIDLEVTPKAVYATTDVNKENPLYYTLWGSISEIKYNNLSRDFFGVAYVKETITEGEQTTEKITYAEFDNEINIRDVVYVASAAYSDEGETYTTEQEDILKGFVSKEIYRVSGKTEEEADAAIEADTYADFSVLLSETAVSLKIGETTALAVSTTVNETTVSLGAYWKSSDESVATVDKKGVVTALKEGTVTITAKVMGQELTCEVTVAPIADFISVPENQYITYQKAYTVGGTGEYSIPMATATEGATVTWNAEEYRTMSWVTGSEVGAVITAYTGETVAINEDIRFHTRITWTLKMGDYTKTAYTYLFADASEEYIGVQEKYPNYIENSVLTGDGISVSDFELLPGMGKSLRLYNGTKSVSGQFNPNVSAGYNPTYYFYYIYNAGTSEVTYTLDNGGTSFTVPAKAYAFVNPCRFLQPILGYDLGTWKLVVDGNLANVRSTAVSSDESAVDLYIGGIHLNADAFDFGTLSVSGSVENNVVTATWDAKAGATKYSYRVLINKEEIVEATELAADATSVSYDYTDYADTAVEVEVEVTAYGIGDDKVTASYIKNNLEFTSVPENQMIAYQTGYTVGGTGEYSIPMATADAGTITWVAEEVYLLSYTDRTIGDVLNTYNQGSAVRINGDERNITRITWTLTVGEYTKTATTYLFAEYYAELEKTYPNYIAEGTVTGDMSVSDFEIVPGSGKSIRLNDGTSNPSGTFTNPVSLGYTRSLLCYYIYNNSESEITYTNTKSAGVTIPAKSYAIFWGQRYGYKPAIIGWGLATSDGKLGTISVSVSTTDGSEADVYIGCVRVNADAFDFGTLSVSGSEENNVATVNWTAMAGATKYTYRVLVDSVEVLAATELAADATTLTYDYSANASASEIVIEVTAYGIGTDTSVATYTIGSNG